MRNSSPPDEAGLGESAESKAAFHLRMRARGVQDRMVLRAFELVPRQTFVPRRYRDLATRDLALPIDCGQTLDEPWLVARMIEVLAVQASLRVLQIGAGTGYATAVLAQLGAEIIAIERCRSLATAAQARVAGRAIANATVLWGDGLSVPAEVAPFDRILVHGLLAELPETLLDRLARDGIMVAARPAGGGQAIKRIVCNAEGIVETSVCSCRLQAIVPGLAAAL